MRLLILLLALLYFLSPFDVLPDGLGPLGRIDDILVALVSYWYYRKGTFRQYSSTSAENSSTQGAKEDSLPPEDSPYTVLGVPTNASAEEIETQYKKLMAQYHPDKVHHLGPELQELAHRKSLQIGKAYQELKR